MVCAVCLCVCVRERELVCVYYYIMWMRCTVGEHMENGRTTMTVAPGTPTAVDLPTTTTPRCRRRTLFNTKMIIIISRHIPGGSRFSSVTGCYRPAGRSQNNVLPPTSGVHPRKVVFFSNTYMYMYLFYTG